MNKFQVIGTAATTAIVGIATATYQYLPGEPFKQTVELSAYQGRCATALGAFIAAAPLVEPKGRYYFTLGEAHRPGWVAQIYAREGKGAANSLHISRLAIDLNLHVDGVYQTSSDPYKPFAELWMSTGKEFGVTPSAGYYFKRQDGNHFGCEWNGTK